MPKDSCVQHKTGGYSIALVAYFEKMGVAGQKVLLLADWRLEQNANLKLSVRNLCWLKLSLPQNLSIKDVIDSDAVVLTPEALATVYERFGVAS